jgi:hypothetical protein
MLTTRQNDGYLHLRQPCTARALGYVASGCLILKAKSATLKLGMMILVPATAPTASDAGSALIGPGYPSPFPTQILRIRRH